MKRSACTTLAVLLVPALAMAAESSPPQTLVVPGVMTPSGQQFAGQCSDDAFAKATLPKRLADTCHDLLARWWAEANLCDGQAISRSGCVAVADGKPSFLSLRGIPRYPPPITNSSGAATSRPGSR